MSTRNNKKNANLRDPCKPEYTAVIATYIDLSKADLNQTALRYWLLILGKRSSWKICTWLSWSKKTLYLTQVSNWAEYILLMLKYQQTAIWEAFLVHPNCKRQGEDVRDNKHLHIVLHLTSLTQGGLKVQEGALIALRLDHFTIKVFSSMGPCCFLGTCSLSDWTDLLVFNTDHKVQCFLLHSRVKAFLPSLTLTEYSRYVDNKILPNNHT